MIKVLNENNGPKDTSFLQDIKPNDIVVVNADGVKSIEWVYRIYPNNNQIVVNIINGIYSGMSGKHFMYFDLNTGYEINGNNWYLEKPTPEIIQQAKRDMFKTKNMDKLIDKISYADWDTIEKIVNLLGMKIDIDYYKSI